MIRKMRNAPRTIAVVGAGVAGLACARTLAQAGHTVTLLEQQAVPGGRTASCETPFGSFDTGAQYFTVRDTRFEQVLAATQVARKAWSANAVRVLDPLGRVAEAALPSREPHWVTVPAMDSLAVHWMQPLAAAGRVQMRTRVTRLEPDALDRQTLAAADQRRRGFGACVLGLRRRAAGAAECGRRRPAARSGIRPVASASPRSKSRPAGP